LLPALIVVFVNGCFPEIGRQAEFVHWQPGQTRPYTVQITGRDFRWNVLYPGSDGKLGTPDDIRDERHLHLPSHTTVRLELRSDDYVYALGFPHWDAKEIAVPGLHFRLEFQTRDPGVFELKGNQMCGFTHPELLGLLTVHLHREFDAWLGEQRRYEQLGTGPREQ
jgi:cytochrome c oxidase subunit 2